MSTKQAKRTLAIVTAGVIVLLALILAMNSVYTLGEQEQAVVVTLGQPGVVMTPGLHMKIPFIQDVKVVSMVIKGFSIGYTDESGNPADYVNQLTPEQMEGGEAYAGVASESMMITSDYNFVNVDFFLEYKVSEPDKYLFASDNPEFILRNLALSYIRDTIGLHTVDEVITTGKNEIQAEIKEKLANRLEQEAIGLQLINITIQDSEPPTEEVKAAFNNVETAKQGKDTAINTARQYESEQVPAARAQEDAILKQADARREARVSEAVGQVAVFNAMFEEYMKNPLMTRQRMFYEAMEDILPGMKLIIDNGEGDMTKLLPLELFENRPVTNAAAVTDAQDDQTAEGE